MTEKSNLAFIEALDDIISRLSADPIRDYAIYLVAMGHSVDIVGEFWIRRKVAAVHCLAKTYPDVVVARSHRDVFSVRGFIGRTRRRVGDLIAAAGVDAAGFVVKDGVKIHEPEQRFEQRQIDHL